jgi:hypothetical protein
VRPETLLKTEKQTVAFEIAPEGKIRANAAGWTEPKVFLADQVLEVRVNAGLLYFVRKRRLPDPNTDPQVKEFNYEDDDEI